MFTIDFSHPVHVHFIGIGGISMSGLAEMLNSRGFTVTGSDRDRSPLTAELESHGIEIACPQSADNIARFMEKAPIDGVVYTAAIHPDNPEFAAAEALGLPMMTRAELLGQLMTQYHNSFAVAGTHGKTTTTAMLSHILMTEDIDPTVSIGAVYPALGGNYRIGRGDVFVAEACEYTNSFLCLHPRVGVILNIEADHLDFFKDLADIRASFRRFAAQIPPEGTLVIGADIENLPELTEGLPCRNRVTFGLTDNADVRAENIRPTCFGDGVSMTTFTVVFRNGDAPFEVTLGVPGLHNVKNALAAIAASRVMVKDTDRIVHGLEDFKGASRRFERLGIWHGITIIDDYAHHPTEIRATLNTARSLGYQRIWCAFQSHTYSRTKALFDDFADALTGADRVVLAEIYAARETDTLGVSSALLGEKIRKNGTPCDCFSSFSELEEFLLQNCSEGDLLIFMGAGEIDKIGFSILSRD